MYKVDYYMSNERRERERERETKTRTLHVILVQNIH